MSIPYGDVEALKSAITSNTAAFMVEPIQGEGGVVVPPDGYIRETAALCRENHVLFVADEIQTGLGRSGKMFACEWDDVHPDMLIVGKALAGGLYPVSAALANDEIMGVFSPGDHGSTFGGNPLGAAVAMAALDVLVDEGLAGRANELGNWFMEQLRNIGSPHVAEVRGRGLMIGVVVRDESGPARPYCEALQARGILAKETHEQVIRFAPPWVIDKETLEWVVGQVKEVLA